MPQSFLPKIVTSRYLICLAHGGVRLADVGGILDELSQILKKGKIMASKRGFL
jgi:hypothetical protein